MKWLNHLPWKEKLGEPGLFILWKAQEELIQVYTYLQGGCKEEGARFFPVVPSARTGGHGHTLIHRKFHLKLRENSLSWRVVEYVWAFWKIRAVGLVFIFTDVLIKYTDPMTPSVSARYYKADFRRIWITEGTVWGQGCYSADASSCTWARIKNSVSMGWAVSGEPVLVRAQNSWSNKNRAQNCGKVANKNSEICVRSCLALLAIAGTLGPVSCPCFMEKKVCQLKHRQSNERKEQGNCSLGKKSKYVDFMGPWNL